MRTGTGTFTLCGDGLCVGFDGGDQVSWSYQEPSAPPSNHPAVASFQVGEHGRPVIGDAHDDPSSRSCDVERLFGALDVVELPLGVVVLEQQSQRRLLGAAGEPEHRDVATGVAERQDGPAADPAPDPYGLF